MISRTLRTASVALALGAAALGDSAGTASAGWYPGKFMKHHHHFGWGPGLGLGLGLAAVGAAGAYAAYGDCYVRRVVTIDGDVFYRKVCY
jgi:hypothetical protein